MPTALHVAFHGHSGVGDAISLLSRIPGYEHARFDFMARPLLVNKARAQLRRRAFAAQMRDADVIHVHGPVLELMHSMLLADKPTIWSAHGLLGWWSRFPRPFRTRAIYSYARRYVRHVDEIMTASSAEADTLISAAPELTDRLTVVPWGLPRVKRQPQARWELRRRLGILDEQITVLMLAGLGNQRLGMTAVEAARSAGADIALLIAGADRATQRLAHRGGPHVHAVAYDEESDVYHLFAAADILLLPVAYQGYGFNLLAAMDYGVAIVAGQSRGHSEMLGDAGLLVPLQQSPLTVALLDLVREPARRTYMAAGARKRARTKYTAERARTGALHAYERAMRVT